MSHETKIEPALSAEEWARARAFLRGMNDDFGYPEELRFSGRHAALIALENAALPDDDPRKITREKIAALRVVLRNFDGVDVGGQPTNYVGDQPVYDTLDGFLDALASYLPPE